MTRPHARGAALALLLSLSLTAGCRAEPQATPPAPSAAQGQEAATIPLAIETDQGVRRFRVEVARTPAEQAQGLMFRRSLAPDAGMIFPFPDARPAAFWMKNTLIPLDMIFIREDGTIARIAANTVPQSLESVESGEPVKAVLEIAGGRSAELGIEEGDRVTWGE